MGFVLCFLRMAAAVLALFVCFFSCALAQQQNPAIQLGAVVADTNGNATVGVGLESAGQVAGFGLSVTFKPAELDFVRAINNTQNLSCNFNSTQMGIVGIACAFLSLQTFPAGYVEPVSLVFQAKKKDGVLLLGTADLPVQREISDVRAREIYPKFDGGFIMAHQPMAYLSAHLPSGNSTTPVVYVFAGGLTDADYAEIWVDNSYGSNIIDVIHPGEGDRRSAFIAPGQISRIRAVPVVRGRRLNTVATVFVATGVPFGIQ